MRRVITYQLQRAVIGGEAPVKQRTNLKEEVEKLFLALGKVYFDKDISFSADIDDNLVVFGDPNDVLEMVGNLCDNACKYGDSTLQVKAGLNGIDGMIEVDVIDDGKGIPEAEREAIFERGNRLDEGSEGQGIGLAVVRDIVNSYRGKIEWPDSQSGHCVRLLLPGTIESTD